MIAFGILFLHVLVSPFRTRARQEAEIVMLRHQLNVLRRPTIRRGPMALGPIRPIRRSTIRRRRPAATARHWPPA
jgi:hypothetical protein